MNKLVLDFGNTWQKTAVFSEGELIETARSKELRREDILIMASKHEISEAILSSVVKHGQDFEKFLHDHFQTIILEAETPLPLSLNYETPSTLGRDRIAAVVASHYLNPDGNSLCIDAGTCITYDLLEEGRIYQGGSISPGLTMRLQSLNTFTSRLPLVSIEDGELGEPPGKSTAASILTGCAWGVIHEMDGWIAHYANKYEGLKCYMTGGDTKIFESKLKSQIFALPNLVLYGLYKILEYNVSSKS